MERNHGLTAEQVAELVDHVKTVCALYHLRVERDGVYRALDWMDPLYRAMLERAIVRTDSSISQFIGPTFRNIFGIDLLSGFLSKVKNSREILLPKGVMEYEGVQSPLSFVARSNLRMMTIAGERDKRQKPPKGVEIPDDATLMLRAQLIMEEAVETCNALGLAVNVTQAFLGDPVIALAPDGRDTDVEEIVDGCCDTIYVAVGTLLAFGVPDMPHLKHVCDCNDAKTPGGVAVTDDTGKVVKPEGWTPPNHERLMEQAPRLNLREIGQQMLEQERSKANAAAT